MLFTSYIGSLAVLALATVPHTVKAICDNPPTAFQIYSNATGKYGQLGANGKPGGHCGASNCAIFFAVDPADATSYFSINANEHLVIAPETTTNPPHGHLAGSLGYIFTGIHSSDVFFAHGKYLEGYPPAGILRCGIGPSPDNDGTCNLSCRHQSFSPPNYAETSFNNEWSLGRLPHEPGFQEIQVKVVFSS